MKRLVTAALSALGILALSSIAGAQLFEPVVNRVGATKWFEPDRVAIQGSNLFFVNRVTVDGVEVPILRNTGVRIVIKPPAVEGPGFATVEVFNRQGSDTGILSYAPTVRATRVGKHMDVQIENAAPGFFVLFASYDLLAEPLSVTGTRHLLMLNMSTPMAEVIASGNLIDSGRILLEHLRIPVDSGLADLPIYLQVYGQQGFGQGRFLYAGELSEGVRLEVTRSFSNVFQLMP